MVNKILSMYILKEMSKISKSNVIYEVFEFTIRNYLDRDGVGIFRQLYKLGYCQLQ